MWHHYMQLPLGIDTWVKLIRLCGCDDGVWLTDMIFFSWTLPIIWFLMKKNMSKAVFWHTVLHCKLDNGWSPRKEDFVIGKCSQQSVEMFVTDTCTVVRRVAKSLVHMGWLHNVIYFRSWELIWIEFWIMRPGSNSKLSRWDKQRNLFIGRVFRRKSAHVRRPLASAQRHHSFIK
jgi:hypothetical protein